LALPVFVAEDGFDEIELRQRILIAQVAPRTYTQFAAWTVIGADL
jgi:hypothetical protein